MGDGPTEMLEERLAKAKVTTKVTGVHTDNRSKENNFGQRLLLLEQGRLVLPRHPALIKQLLACEFETSEVGNIKIAVPERAGHDDIVMGLSLAIPAIRSDMERRRKRALLGSISIGEINSGLRKSSHWGAGAGINFTGTAGGARREGLGSYRDDRSRIEGSASRELNGPDSCCDGACFRPRVHVTGVVGIAGSRGRRAPSLAGARQT